MLGTDMFCGWLKIGVVPEAEGVVNLGPGGIL
jgi:hypothetical protein